MTLNMVVGVVDWDGGLVWYGKLRGEEGREDS